MHEKYVWIAVYKFSTRQKHFLLAKLDSSPQKHIHRHQFCDSNCRRTQVMAQNVISTFRWRPFWKWPKTGSPSQLFFDGIDFWYRGRSKEQKKLGLRLSWGGCTVTLSGPWTTWFAAILKPLLNWQKIQILNLNYFHLPPYLPLKWVADMTLELRGDDITNLFHIWPCLLWGYTWSCWSRYPQHRCNKHPRPPGRECKGTRY